MLKQAKSLKNNYWAVVPKVQDYPSYYIKLQYILLINEVQKRFVVLSISKGYFQ